MHTRNLQYLHALALQIEIGLWSGDKRKMEMANGFMGLFVNVSIYLRSLVRRIGTEKNGDNKDGTKWGLFPVFYIPGDIPKYRR